MGGLSFLHFYFDIYMYVCMYVCVYIYIYIYIYIQILLLTKIVSIYNIQKHFVINVAFYSNCRDFKYSRPILRTSYQMIYDFFKKNSNI